MTYDSYDPYLKTTASFWSPRYTLSSPSDLACNSKYVRILGPNPKPDCLGTRTLWDIPKSYG